MKVLITGISGFIAQYLLVYQPQQVQIVGTVNNADNWRHSPFFEQVPVRPLNLMQPVGEQLAGLQVDAVIHTAAMSKLDACQTHPQMAERINHLATRELAQWCQQTNTRLIFLSTDIVFGGKAAPYKEQDQPIPINVYGKTKYRAEQAVTEEVSDSVIARLPLTVGKGLGVRKNFLDNILTIIREGKRYTVFVDEVRTPTLVDDVALALWRLTLSSESGIFHLGGGKAVSRWWLALLIARQAGYNGQNLIPIPREQIATYPRPLDVSLASTRHFQGAPFRLPPIDQRLQILALR